MVVTTHLMIELILEGGGRVVTDKVKGQITYFLIYGYILMQ